jgi:pimeloyl-ACP methyl ester carboxylesterase
MNEPVRTQNGYASINGLTMYYEIHGEGEPLVLLHGGLTTIDLSFGAMIPTLAETRQVIAIEQQGHGHTADIDRPLTHVQMADDTAALLGQLKIEKADFFGFSDGGIVALGIAIRHPSLVHKLAVAATNFNNEGLDPQSLEFMKNATPEALGPMLRDAYAHVAPRPEDWPTLVGKVMKQGVEFKGWRQEDIQCINAPTLVMSGDRDVVRPEHSVELFRLLPHANLAILPSTDHFMRLQKPVWLLSMLTEFLAEPVIVAK